MMMHSNSKLSYPVGYATDYSNPVKGSAGGLGKALLALAMLCLAMSAMAVQRVPVNIGVLAFRGGEQAIQRWQPMVDYLNEQLPGYLFKVVPLNLQQVSQATEQGTIDFVLTNPGNYVLLESRYGVSRIATLKRHWKGHEYDRYGAVIFTRRDNVAIREIADLREHSLMVVNDRAFGGFQMAWRELKDAGIDPFQDLSELRFNGFPQDNIVHAVLAGEVDAGTVRTGMLENLALQGKIQLQDLRVLGSRNEPGFQFLHSTRLYPEWPLAKLKHTSDPLSRLVLVALFSAQPEQFSLTGSDDIEWTIPLDYSAVHELMKDLRIGPYLPDKEISLVHFVKAYARSIAFVALLLVGLSLVTVYVLRVNRRLVDTQDILRGEIAERISAQKKLDEHRRSLEQRVEQRTASLAELNQALRHSEQTLRELNRIATKFPMPLEQKIHILMELARQHFGFTAGTLYRRDMRGITVVERVGGKMQATVDRGQTVETTEFDQLLQDETLVMTERMLEAGNKSLLEKSGWKSCIAVKVVVEGVPYGFLCLADEQEKLRMLGEVDRDILQLIADWIGMEVARKQIADREQQHLSDLAHVTRLSTMGEMASGLAHELNQPLTAIANYTRGCLRRMNDGNVDMEGLRGIMQQSVREAERAAEIIRSMRAFVNKEDPQHERIDVNPLVQRVAGFVSYELEREGITLQFSLADELPAVNADAIQIEQVLLNLLRNAMEAVREPTDGKAWIEVISRESPPGSIRIEVRDNGCGLPHDNESSIFDPFYTTRDAGMGMGLSISRTIIEAHGGEMFAHTIDGSTTVGFTLPAGG